MKDAPGWVEEMPRKNSGSLSPNLSYFGLIIFVIIRIIYCFIYFGEYSLREAIGEIYSKNTLLSKLSSLRPG